MSHSSLHPVISPPPSSRPFFLPVAAALGAAGLLLLFPGPSPAIAAEQQEGAALFQKYCIACHAKPPKLNTIEDIYAFLRTPPPGMPLFGSDKLPDRSARAIGEYLYASAPAETTAAPEPAKPSKSDKPAKNKKTWLKGFGTSDE